MSDITSTLIEEWILRELVAEGVVDKVQQDYIFHGDRTDYVIEVKARPRKRPTRLIERFTRGYN